MMKNFPKRSARWQPHARRLLGVLSALLMTAGASSAEELVANTKLRLTVLQWQPVKGDFSRWDELSGEFSVSTKESLTLPVAGSISVAGKEPDVLAAEIATLIQMKLGLVAAPSTRVEVVEYPPIYVAGDVAEPGEYKYRPGMTVVQALALGGGIYRTSNRAKKDDIQVTGELRGYQIEMLGAQIRIARLEAELAGATSIAFPKPPLDAEDAALVAQMRTQEELVFASRANELQRQTKSLDELRGLLQGEISTLQQKIESLRKASQRRRRNCAASKYWLARGSHLLPVNPIWSAA